MKAEVRVRRYSVFLAIILVLVEVTGQTEDCDAGCKYISILINIFKSQIFASIVFPIFFNVFKLCSLL